MLGTRRDAGRQQDPIHTGMATAGMPVIDSMLAGRKNAGNLVAADELCSVSREAIERTCHASCRATAETRQRKNAGRSSRSLFTLLRWILVWEITLLPALHLVVSVHGVRNRTGTPPDLASSIAHEVQRPSWGVASVYAIYRSAAQSGS